MNSSDRIKQEKVNGQEETDFTQEIIQEDLARHSACTT